MWIYFYDAGSMEMTSACQKIGHFDEGSAVITPGFKLPAKYVIHAVGPRWYGGEHNEPKFLYSAYKQSLLLAKDLETELLCGHLYRRGRRTRYRNGSGIL